MNALKVALVTGGMGGLGEAICRRLAREGFQVAATYSPWNDNARIWLDEQKQDGFEFAAYMADIADYSSCEVCTRKLLAEQGRIDVLINNAGITLDATLKKMTPEKWRRVRETDLDSVFNMSKQVVDEMTGRGWGRIINISSVNGEKGAIGQTNYCAAKAGIHGFTMALARELAKKGITVNTVSPGYLRTSMVMAVPNDILEKKILPEIPVGRLGEPDEVAGLIAYLCTEDAAFITGANLSINGGQHMH